MSQVEDLQAENAWLKDRIKELTGSDATSFRIQRALGVSFQKSKMLNLLMQTDGAVSHRAVWSNVFEHDNGDMPLNKIKDVVLCQIRRELKNQKAPEGIKTIWGKGYEMTPELRAWIKKRIAT